MKNKKNEKIIPIDFKQYEENFKRGFNYTEIDIPWQNLRSNKSLYRPEYAKWLLLHMSKGFSFASFAGVVGVARSTLEHWAKIYPDFADAKEKGRMAELLVWEKMHVRCATQNKGNAQAIMWGQKVKFPDIYKEPGQSIVSINNNNTSIGQATVIWDEAAETRLKQLEEKQKQIEVLKAKNDAE